MSEAWIGGGLCLLVSLGLARLWRRRGWGDAPEGLERARKLQLAAVPAVGGLAIGAAWLVGGLLLGERAGYGLVPRLARSPWRAVVEEGYAGDGPAFAPWTIALALLVALGSGWLDDARRGGLPPWAKLLFQAAAGFCLSLFFYPSDAVVIEFLHDDRAITSVWLPGATWTGAALALLAVCVLNAVNTFDNADGAVCGVVGTGLLAVGSPFAPAVLVFLLPNLLLRRSRPSGSDGPGRDPWAYLGDAGSQLVGLALVVTPAAWPALLLPALDLARVSLVRVLARQRPWVGDRRHLAHRLQRRGLGPLAVAAALLAIAAPAIFWPGLAGALGTLALFALACLATRGVREP